MTTEHYGVVVTAPPEPTPTAEVALLEWLMSLPIPAEDGKREREAA